jgi:hypothetical protein
MDQAILEKWPLLFCGFEGPVKVMESQTLQELMSTPMCLGLKFQGFGTDGDVAILKII